MQNLKHIPIECESVAETSDTAFGDGTGIVMVAETSTGCLLGASGIGERGVQAEQIANTAADELIDAICSGACVDQWCALAHQHLLFDVNPPTTVVSIDLMICHLHLVTNHISQVQHCLCLLVGCKTS